MGLTLTWYLLLSTCSKISCKRSSSTISRTELPSHCSLKAEMRSASLCVVVYTIFPFYRKKMEKKSVYSKCKRWHNVKKNVTTLNSVLCPLLHMKRCVCDQHCVSASRESFQCCTAQSKDNPPASHCHILALSLLAPCGHYCEWDLCLFCHTLIIHAINHSPDTSVRCISQLCFHTI